MQRSPQSGGCLTVVRFAFFKGVVKSRSCKIKGRCCASSSFDAPPPLAGQAGCRCNPVAALPTRSSSLLLLRHPLRRFNFANYFRPQLVTLTLNLYLRARRPCSCAVRRKKTHIRRMKPLFWHIEKPRGNRRTARFRKAHKAKCRTTLSQSAVSLQFRPDFVNIITPPLQASGSGCGS